jgi:hypothetical protein
MNAFVDGHLAFSSTVSHVDSDVLRVHAIMRRYLISSNTLGSVRVLQSDFEDERTIPAVVVDIQFIEKQTGQVCLL